MKALGNDLYESEHGMAVMIVDMSGDKEANLKSYYDHIKFEDGYYVFFSAMLNPWGPSKN